MEEKFTMKDFKKLSRIMKLILIFLIIETTILFIISLLKVFRVGIFSTIGDWIQIAGYANFFIFAIFLSIANARGRKSGKDAVDKKDDNSQ